jgi:hypothetical protein
MGMLSDGDIKRMGADVRNAISDWDASVVIKMPKPINEQPNYNKLMREFTGDVVYNEYPISGEWRSKAENKQLNTSVSGDSMVNKAILVLPDIFNVDITTVINTIDVCTKDSVIYDDIDRKYRITSIRTNIGQVSLELLQLVGGDING